MIRVASALRSAAVAALLLPFTPARLHGETADAKYRGFTIDDSAVRKMPEVEAMRTATKEQIDMVCAVGVPKEILEFFQSVPFALVPVGTIPRGTPGFYQSRSGGVRVVSNIITTGHKPVLLHELLHAYHDQKVKDGFKNRDIAGFYERARALDAYAAKSHMMQNDREFFACAATTYLFGVTAQEPFERAKIKTKQPELVAYLAKLFGPDAGNYAGSLTR